jgi:hypothetical protein
MKNILHSISLAAAWLLGGIFFFFLSIYIALFFLTKGLRKLFRWKGLYHFREDEFPLLNVMCDSEKNIPMGKLPLHKGETFTYKIPVAAKEVLLELKLAAYPKDTNIEFDYCLSAANDSALKKEFIYIFINPFDSMQLSYDRVLLWYRLPEDRILKVQFTDVKADNTSIINIDGYLNVVQVR